MCFIDHQLKITWQQLMNTTPRKIENVALIIIIITINWKTNSNHRYKLQNKNTNSFDEIKPHTEKQWKLDRRI